MPITLNGDTGITTPMYNGAIAANVVTPVTAFKNRLINGACVIDQRNSGASVTIGAGFTYTLDRWQIGSSSGSKVSAQQNAASVTPPAGFRNYLGITSLSAYSVPAGEQYGLRQLIEGLNVADLGWGTASAQTVTLSFWVRSSLTGTFGGVVSNDSNRSYPFTYSIPSANTWTFISVTIPGDTTGTWATNTNVGISVVFGLGVGSSISGTAGSWQTGNFFSATGATSVVGTNGATWYITGIQFEVGSSATSFETRPYTTELQLCQRYFQRFGSVSYAGIASGVQGSTTYSCFTLLFTCPMRIAPTMTFFNLIATERAFFDIPITSTSFVHISPNGAFMALNHNAAGAYGNGILLCVQGGTTGFIDFNSEI